MDMPGLGDIMANLNTLNPRIRNDLLNRPPLRGIGLQHLPNEWTTRSRAQVIDRRRARRDLGVRTRTCLRVRVVQLVRSRLRRTPGQFLEMQAVVNDTTRPNIHEPSIVSCDPTAANLTSIGRGRDLRKRDKSGCRSQNVRLSARLTFVQELFWCDVRLTAAQTRRHMYRLLPREAIHSGSSIVSDLSIAINGDTG